MTDLELELICTRVAQMVDGVAARVDELALRVLALEGADARTVNTAIERAADLVEAVADGLRAELALTKEPR